MSDLQTVKHSCIFPLAQHGDLTLEWDEDKQDAMTAQIQALIDKGVVFFRLEGAGKKQTGVQVSETSEITDRKVLIKDPDIAKIVDAGIATLATFKSVGDIKTSGKVASAKEAATTDTVAMQPAKGG